MAEQSPYAWLFHLHPLYKANVGAWEKYRAVFEGGAYMEPYLVQHRAEKAGEFDSRRQHTVYENHAAAVLENLVMFLCNKSQPITRHDAAGWEEFLESVDGQDTGVDEWIQQAALSAGVYGVEWLGVDVPDLEERPATRAEERAAELNPYWYTIHPLDVLDWIVDNNQLVMVKVRSAAGDKRETLETSLDAGQYKYQVWTLEDWSLYEPDKGGHYHKTKEGKNPLGVIPLYPLCWWRTSDRTIGYSALKDIGDLAVAIYNWDSQRSQLLFDNAWSQVIVNADPASLGNVEWGSQRVLCVPPDIENRNLFPPYHLSAEPQWCQYYSDLIRQSVDQIYALGRTRTQWRTADQAGQSGVAKQWDFHFTNQTLARVANNLEAAENWLYWVTQAWKNGGGKPEEGSYPRAEYPKDFYVKGIAEDVEELEKLQAVGMPPAVVKYQKHIIAQQVMDKATDAEREQAQEEIEHGVENTYAADGRFTEDEED